MKANESIEKYPARVREYANYTVKSIKNVCKTCGPRIVGSESDAKAREYFRKNDYTDEDIAECLNEDNEDTLKLCRDNLGYFIAYENLFSVWTNPKSDFVVFHEVRRNKYDNLEEVTDTAIPYSEIIRIEQDYEQYKSD